MHNLWFRAATAAAQFSVARKKEYFVERKNFLERQTAEAMFTKKRKFQSYMPTNWHNVSKLNKWSEIGIMF